jgi:hypothetical protein
MNTCGSWNCAITLNSDSIAAADTNESLYSQSILMAVVSTEAGPDTFRHLFTCSSLPSSIRKVTILAGSNVEQKLNDSLD